MFVVYYFDLQIANIIYLHEMDELLGGDGLNAYDMMYVVSNDIKWHQNESDLDETKTILKNDPDLFWNDRNNEKELDCIIYDRVGDLLDLYKYADLAYVGCGFSSGVHNVAEPALQGCYISYGPNIELLDEAVKLKEQKLSKIIYNSDDFSDFTNISDVDFLDKNRHEVFDLFKKNDNDIEKVIKIIYE